MAQVEVRRLRYRGDAARAGRVEHAIGDALRTETTDDGRLILVRRLPLGRIGVGERGAARATARAWRDLVGAARHGGESGAEAADCVWFASPAEARMLMLRELARGRTPFAWFWALAVPDWRRMTLARYLGHRLALALAEPSGEAIAALVDEALAAGACEALAKTILARVPGGTRGAQMPVERSPPPRQPERPTATAATPDSAAKDTERALALGLLRTVPPPLQAALRRLAAQPGADALIEAVALGLVRRAHPALALAPRRLTHSSRLLVELLRTGEGLSARRPGEHPGSAAAPTPSPAGETSREAPPTEKPPGDDTRHEPVAAKPEAPPAPPPAPLAQAEPSPPPEGEEQASAAAGLFLVIVPLLRLGWREWLAERPDWLLHQPGARLLHAIARHYRVPPGDALWSALPELHHEIEPLPPLETALALWRKGLDGWLRRTARLTLAELILRRGWLLPGPDATIVRFPLGAIDIRLRRRALDSDPGWVDWLGHSYRLVYRDRPLTGPQRP